MGIKTYKPTTPSRRAMTTSDFSEITKKTPEKSLLAKKTKTAGRNARGVITVRHRGGGNRKKYRIIDFKRRKDDMFATVIGIEYDPNRTANIALIEYEDGTRSYILAPRGLTDGDKIISGETADIKPGQGGKMAKAAGNSAQLMAKEEKYSHIKLPSGEMRLVLSRCRATIGRLRKY